MSNRPRPVIPSKGSPGVTGQGKGAPEARTVPVSMTSGSEKAQAEMNKRTRSLAARKILSGLSKSKIHERMSPDHPCGPAGREDDQ